MKITGRLEFLANHYVFNSKDLYEKPHMNNNISVK